MKIRTYQKSDIPNIKKLVYRVLFEIFHSKPRNLQDLDNITKNYDAFYILEGNNKIVGCVAIKKYKRNIARLKRLYLDKKYRRKGYGFRLLNKAISYCRHNGYKKIMFSSHERFSSAIKLYQKSGFKKYKKLKDQIFFIKNLK